MSTICLSMIVKNESHVIEKTLENLCSYIDFKYWVISDTGSTDNTAEIIQAFFKRKKIKGEIRHDPWVDFAHNRNCALAPCEGKTDYVLFFDADDYIQGDFRLPENLTEDAYNFKIVDEGGGTAYQRKLLVRNNGYFYWRCVVHEYIENKGPISTGTIEGNYNVVSCRKGDRNRDQMKKHISDATILEKACLENKEPDLFPRYAFYCAQSYKAAQMPEKAIEWYKKRAETTEGWKDERFYSYLCLGFLYEDQKDFVTAYSYWQQAILICPERAEAWYHMSRRANWEGKFEFAYAHARQALLCPKPTGGRLFLNVHIYDYWRHYEVCINAFQLKYFDESYEAFKAMLEYAPQDLLQRIEKQLPSYKEAIAKDSFENVKSVYQKLKAKSLDNMAEAVLSLT